MSKRTVWSCRLAMTFILVGITSSARASFSFSTPASPGAVTPGLLDSVYHLGPNTVFSPETGDQATDAGTITTVAAFAAANTPNYTFMNTTDSFNYNLGPVVNPADEEPTNAFLGSDAAGLAALDVTPIETSIFDSEGFIYIGKAGTYTIDSSAADDAVRVYLGGNGTAGSGTAIFDRNYNFFSNPPTDYSGPTPVAFTQAGYYPIEILYYNDYSGGSGAAELELSITPDTGLPAVSFATGSVPEPSVLGLLMVSALITGSWHRKGLGRGQLN